MKLSLASLFFLMTFLISGQVWAADELSVVAEVNSKDVPINQKLVFSITITGAVRGVLEPELPPIDGFTKVGQASSSNISIINMSMTTSKKISYTLQPQKKGAFTIPSLSFTHKGKVYSTYPIQVRVGDPVKSSRKRRRRAGNQFGGFGGFFDDQFSFRDRTRITEDDVFAKMEPDLIEAYVNQEIVLTFSLYYAEGLQFYQDPAYTQPAFKDMWVEDIPVRNRGEYTILNDRRFVVSRVKHAVFPVTSGDLTIGDASVAVQFDPFSSAVRVSSKPLKIKVKPLPPRPPGIEETSLVGSFGIHAELDKVETKTGEPVELTVMIKGIGNIRSITNPVPPPLDSFEIYGPEEKESMEKGRGIVEGDKVFKYILIPRDEGEFTIGAFKSAYFDPEKKIYRKLETASFKVNVLPGKIQATSNGSNVSKSEIELLGKDISYIKGDKTSLINYEGPLYRKPLYRFLIVVPPVILLVFLFLNMWRRRLESDPASLRRARAFKAAGARIGEMEQSVSEEESKIFYADLENILREYIGNKLNTSPPAVEPENLETLLNGDGGELMLDLKTLFEKCSMARFSASGLSAEERKKSLRISKKTIVKLEKYL